MSDCEYSWDGSISFWDEGGSSGNKSESNREDIFDKDMKEMLSRMKTFNPCIYETERDVSTCSNESDVSEFDKNKY